jgi:hypothetical protein
MKELVNDDIVHELAREPGQIDIETDGLPHAAASPAGFLVADRDGGIGQVIPG